MQKLFFYFNILANTYEIYHPKKIYIILIKKPHRKTLIPTKDTSYHQRMNSLLK